MKFRFIHLLLFFSGFAYQPVNAQKSRVRISAGTSLNNLCLKKNAEILAENPLVGTEFQSPGFQAELSYSFPLKKNLFLTAGAGFTRQSYRWNSIAVSFGSLNTSVPDSFKMPDLPSCSALDKKIFFSAAEIPVMIEKKCKNIWLGVGLYGSFLLSQKQVLITRSLNVQASPNTVLETKTSRTGDLKTVSGGVCARAAIDIYKGLGIAVFTRIDLSGHQSIPLYGGSFARFNTGYSGINLVYTLQQRSARAKVAGQKK